MGFFDRLGHGFMVGLHSLAFGFHHFSVFWYMLFYGIVLLPVTVMDITTMGDMITGEAGRFFGVTVLSFIINLVAYIFIVAIIRRVVFSFEKKKIGFWHAMKMDVKMWVAIGIFVFINMAFENVIEYVTDLGHSGLAHLLGLGLLAWTVCTLFFVSVVTIENVGFFDAVGRSTRYFGRVFLEVICAGIMLSALMLGAMFVIASVFGLDAHFLLNESLTELGHMVVNMRDLVLLTPGIILSAVTWWFFATGIAVALPSLYYMAKKNKKMPFA